jgi:hypothetical protein
MSPERYRVATGALLICADPLHRLPVSDRDREIHRFSRRSQEMIAVAFLSFAILVVAWFIAPSRAHVAE